MNKGKRRSTTTAARLIGLAAAAGVVLVLPACGNRVLDTGLFGAVLGNDPPVKDDTTLVRGLSGENKEYPNLGTVPPRPTNLRTEAQRKAEMDRLAQDRDAAKKMLPTPAEVPPKPVITPGKPG